MKCKWCGKELVGGGAVGTFCSNKCIAEHDNHHGIDPAKRNPWSGSNVVYTLIVGFILFILLGVVPSCFRLFSRP